MPIKIMFDYKRVKDSQDLFELHQNLSVLSILISIIIYIAVLPLYALTGRNDYFGFPISLAIFISFFIMLVRSRKYTLNDRLRKNPRLRRGRYLVWVETPFLILLAVLSFKIPIPQSQILCVVSYNLFIVLSLLFRNRKIEG